MSRSSTISLTVKEQPALAATAVPDYSLVLALSDAGGRNMGNQKPRLQGRPPVEENTVYLWRSGCRVGDGWDCGAACTDPARVWNDTNAMFTYQNCLLQPILASSSAEQWLVEEPAGLLDKYGISPNYTALTGSGEGVWPVINACTQAFCHEIRPHSEYCLGGLGHEKFKYALGPSDAPRHPVLRIDTKFCSRGYNTPNTDIGGPGVLASYIQQLAIVILTWAFLRVPDVCLADRMSTTTASGANDNVQRIHSRRRRPWRALTAWKAHPATIATAKVLLDFQEAQVFFSITLQIASVVALYKSQTRLLAPTVAELVANRFLLKAIGAIGSYPVVLNLCTIRKYKDKENLLLERYVLIASCCCVVFATITWSLALSTTFDKAQLQQDEFRLRACGGENPMQHCFGDFAVDRTKAWWAERWSLTVFDDVFLGGPAVFVPLVVLLSLVARRITNLRLPDRITNLRVLRMFSKVLAKVKAKSGNQKQKQHNILGRVLAVFLAVAELWLFISTIVLLVAVSLLLVPVSYRQPHWQIGQILAVAVWAPVLVKWLHLLYGGDPTTHIKSSTNGTSTTSASADAPGETEAKAVPQGPGVGIVNRYTV